MKNSEKATAVAAEKARLAGLLKQKVDAYVEGIEDNNRAIDFDRVPADQLLVIEAFNDWSAGALGEDVDVRFTFSGADPACATEEELQNLLSRLHTNQAILYPVTGFLLSQDEQSLRYRPIEASYRLRPHLDGSRASAVRVAEAKHISDVEAAHQLWVTCATEDCFAYLTQQMSLYSLCLEDEEIASTKRLVASYVQDRFSPAQIWNAMWRSVKHAAALSKRDYFNSVKAAKTIPKKIDKVLNKALEDPSFQAYDRMLSTPVGAVLMLFRQRFGVGDLTPGWKVKEVLAADAALAPPENGTDNNDPDDDGVEGYVPNEVLARGTLYFQEEVTELDRLALACFEGAQLESEMPTWDEAGLIGSIDFTLPDLYAFSGKPFFIGVLKMLNASAPTEEQVSRRAAELPDDRWARSTAYAALATDALLTAGISERAAGNISWATQYPVDPEEVIAMLQGIPLPSGLIAMRLDYTSLGDSYSIKKDCIAVGRYNLAIPEDWFEPDGSDQEIVKSFVKGDTDSFAGILAAAIRKRLRSSDAEEHSWLLEQIGRKLIALSSRDQPIGAGCTNPRT
ncbi:hypothetical protein [Paucibacter sp. B51]|uniref:hypothetical protein n=1 Tax=Paucibacter sp. B51 TaxID=2993315 RepID=UPI0022EC10C5|nr:hypothetical protein [Paucibacter sp. B51]